ncbi:hypothetical protein GCM10011321_22340 [Youhaiella tibetensis]|nr:hypothetical protein GCM10011321_22340 [Youhaiella tibetensis]
MNRMAQAWKAEAALPARRPGQAAFAPNAAGRLSIHPGSCSMTEFTPLMSLAGGSLIGLSAVLLMAFHGRIAGMTGILTGMLPPVATDWPWRIAFLAGAVAAPALILAATGQSVDFSSPVPAPWLVLGGLVVGIGVYFGGGCTSGHGVCGIARLSPRSIVATLTFMATAAASVFVLRHVLGAF